MRRSTKILLGAALVAAPLFIAGAWRDRAEREARRTETMERIAETYCGVCHRATGDYDMAVPAALRGDPAALGRRLTDAATEFAMPPSPWHRARLAELVRATLDE